MPGNGFGNRTRWYQRYTIVWVDGNQYYLVPLKNEIRKGVPYGIHDPDQIDLFES